MATYHYAVQCTDKTSGKIGCFIYDDSAKFVAISPVCVDLVELFAWMRAHGWRSIPGGIWTCEQVS